MSDNTLILHIGLHRTGTTALQQFLADNRDALDRAGLTYPRLDKHNHHCNLIVPWQNRDNGIFTSSLTKAWQPVLDRLDTSKNPLLISCENIHFHLRQPDRALELRELLKNINVRFLIYLRRQDLHMESWYAYSVQNLHESKELLESKTFRHIETQDFYTTLQTVANVFGKSTITVRTFEPSVWPNGSLFKDFLDAIEIPWNQEFKEPPRRINAGINPRLFGLCRAAHDRFSNSSEGLSFVDVARKISSRMNKTELSLFTPEQRREHLEKFEEGNCKIAREYFNREQLFTETKPPLPRVKEEPDFLREVALDIHSIWFETIHRHRTFCVCYTRAEQAIRHWVHITGKVLFQHIKNLRLLRSCKRD